MELDKNIKKQMAELLADPEKVSSQHTAMLNELLQEYPYYQPLHLLLAKANIYIDNDNLAKAALYTNGQLLHQFLYKPATKRGDFHFVPIKSACEEAVDPAAEDQTAELAVSVELTDPAELMETAEVEESEAAEPLDVDSEETASQTDEDQEVFEEISELNQETITAQTPVAVSPAQEVPMPETAESAFEENEKDQQIVFEEIAEVDLNNYRPFRNGENGAVKQPQTEEPVTERKNSLEDDFVFESIASTDFFAFEENFSAETMLQEEKTSSAPPFIEEHDEAAAAEVENSQLSNYHDEKLPYTFLWWLAKTRKEHQSIFQPYVITKQGNSQELQQQYVEHIFHIQSHLTGTEALLDEETADKPVTKDSVIIENFIKKDPQITPPHADQIDNENKAKKSAEDQNDLVSETLANIYIEQMLYDKAIDTYEKLSLKFPEKRRYFADLIQSIEKKI